MANQVFEVIKGYWIFFFTMVNSFVWILSILPIVVAFYAIKLAKKRIGEDSERIITQRGYANEITRMDEYIVTIKYLVTSIIMLYIVYGTFTLVFAGLDFNDGWDKLVVAYWREFLQIK